MTQPLPPLHLCSPVLYLLAPRHRYSTLASAYWGWKTGKYKSKRSWDEVKHEAWNAWKVGLLWRLLVDLAVLLCRLSCSHALPTGAWESLIPMIPRLPVMHD